MKIAFTTLGCKANQFDTQALGRMFSSRGHDIVDFDDEADVYVVNTCTVTAESDRKSRQTINGVKRRAPDAVLAVCGCFSQVSPESAKALGADVVAGTKNRDEFIALVEKAYNSKAQSSISSPYKVGEKFEILPAGGYDGRTRALLKVQDGCDNYCTYCIIPYSRGHIRSMPMDKAVEAVIDLENRGYREIVLTGIEISSYGLETHEARLVDLLENLCHAAPDVRIHLGSLEPRTVTRDFCERISRLPNLLPHFHLSLQSGCDETLKRMRRRYDTARFYESAEFLREFFPNCCLTADLITGFPGETEEEFSETLKFIKKCDFGSMHVFPYSSRPGTPAAAMPQLTKAVKSERARRAGLAAAEMHKHFMEAQKGLEASVLFEEPENDHQVGHTQNYLPVKVKTCEELRGTVRKVMITGIDDGILTAELI